MNNFTANAALLFAGKSLILGLRVVSLLAMARYGESPLVFAYISFALAASEVGRLVADWGTETWCVRAVALASSTQEKSQAICGALRVKGLASIPVCAALIVICIVRFDSGGLAIGACAAVMLVAGQFSGIAIAYLQAESQLSRLRILVLPTFATAVAVAAALLVSHNSLLTLACLAAGESLAAGILTHTLIADRLLSLRALRVSGVADIARQCVPVALLTVVIGIHLRLDTFMLSEWSLPALAVYTVAHRMFQPFQVAAGSLGSATYARVAQLIRTDRKGQARSTAWRSDLMLVGCIAFALSAILWSGGALIIQMFLPEYSASEEILRILALTLVISAFNSVATGVLLAHARFGAVLCMALFQLVCSFLGMSLLIPRFGAFGAALGLLLAESANAAVQYPTAWYVWRRRRAPVVLNA